VFVIGEYFSRQQTGFQKLNNKLKFSVRWSHFPEGLPTCSTEPKIIAPADVTLMPVYPRKNILTT